MGLEQSAYRAELAQNKIRRFQREEREALPGSPEKRRAGEQVMYAFERSKTWDSRIEACVQVANKDYVDGVENYENFKKGVQDFGKDPFGFLKGGPKKKDDEGKGK